MPQMPSLLSEDDYFPLLALPKEDVPMPPLTPRIPPPQRTSSAPVQTPTKTTKPRGGMCPSCHLSCEDRTHLSKKTKELKRCAQFHLPKMAVGTQTSGGCPQALSKEVSRPMSQNKPNPASTPSTVPAPDPWASLTDGKPNRSVSFQGPVTKIRNRSSHSRLSSDDESDFDSRK